MRRVFCYLPVCLLLSCSTPPESDLRLSMPSVETITFAHSKQPHELERLFGTDPVLFLERCVERAEREVHGYRATLIKQERINGKLGHEEEIAVHFREAPFSVLMEWKRGQGLARRTLFIEGEHDNQIVVQLAGWRAFVGQVTCAVDDEDAKATSRYPINEFGMKKGMLRTLTSWKEARERGDLRVCLKGTTRIAELGDRECWVVHRIESPGSDPEGIVDSTFYFDVESGLQVGTLLRDEQGQLVGRYLFREVERNPVFNDKTFCRDRLKQR